MAAALRPDTRRVDITWQAGDDRPAVIDAPDADGQPQDLTGWSALAVASRSGRPVQTWSTDDDTAKCGPDGVTLYPDDSATWAWRNATFDVRLTSPDGTNEVLAWGDMTVRALRATTPVLPPPPVAPPGCDPLVPDTRRAPRAALTGIPTYLIIAWWHLANAMLYGSRGPLGPIRRSRRTEGAAADHAATRPDTDVTPANPSGSAP